MHQRTLSAMLLLLVCPLLLAVVQTLAQEDGGGDGDPVDDFFEVVDVEIANIDVWVTDKKGQPITGLTEDDFVVFKDGEQVEISNFYAVTDGLPAAAPTDGQPPTTVADPDDSLRSVENLRLPLIEPGIDPDHRLWMIVYIDNFNLEPIERNRVFPALRQFLGQSLRPGDQAMLVTYNRSLEVKQEFTEQGSLIAAALDEIEDDAGHATIRNRDRFATLQRIDQSDSPSQALIYARQYAEEQMNGVQYTVRALERLIDSLGGLPGRKAVVHVSSGVPMAAGEEMFQAVGEIFEMSEAYGEIPRHDTSRQFERVNRYANAHRVSFYTIDAGGLRGMEFGNAEYGGFVNGRIRSMLDSVVPENLQAPLRLMALETGGQAILNQNNILPALEKAAQDFRTFYSLGIASTTTDSGRYHKIEVELRERRKDLRIRHREGYRSKTMETRARESLRSALLYSPQTDQEKVEVTWGAAEPFGTDGNYLVPIRLRIPLRNVVLLPTEAGHHVARLRLFVGAVGEEGTTSEIDAAPLGVRLADEHVEAARAESLLHTHKLVLSPGKKRVGVLILDVFGRETSMVIRTLHVGPQAPAEAR